MTDRRGRVQRQLTIAQSQLRTVQHPDDAEQQYEAFLDCIEAARKAWELLNDYCSKAGLDELKKEFFERRNADPLAIYAWEARNAENHDIDGATDFVEDGFGVGPDASGNMYIKHMTVNSGVVVGTGYGFDVTPMPANFSLKTVSTRSKLEIDPPAPPFEVAKALTDLVREYFKRSAI